MSLLELLENTASPGGLQAAQIFLDNAANSNLADLLKSLSDIVAGPNNPVIARQQAGLQLKNYVYSKDDSLRESYSKRWLQISPHIRTEIKNNVLQSLGTEQSSSAAAQCVGYIACIELPVNEWKEVIDILAQHVSNAESTSLLREAALEAIGYICEDIEVSAIESMSNTILTAIVHGMRTDEPSNRVRTTATKALLNSLEFTKSNFFREVERNYIMKTICEATQSSCTETRVAALQCLVRVMSLYYHLMEGYMGPALFAITVDAMKSEVSDISLQGIEFWSTVCEEEMDLAIEATEAQQEGRPPEKTSQFYAKGGLKYLMPILLDKLAQQNPKDSPKKRYWFFPDDLSDKPAFSAILFIALSLFLFIALLYIFTTGEVFNVKPDLARLSLELEMQRLN